MPTGSGLDPVTQKFLADNSDTIAKIRQIKQEYRELQDLMRSGIKISVESGGEDIGKVNAAIREQLKTFRDMSPVMDEAIRRNKEFNASQIETAKLSKDGAEALRSLMDAHGMLREKATRGQQDIADSFVKQMSHLDQMVVRLGAAKDAYGSLGDASKPLQYTTADIEKLNRALNVAEKSANSFVTAFYGEGGASRGGDAGRFIGAGAFGPIPPGGATFGGGGDRGGFAAAAGGFFGAMRPSNIFGGALPTVQMAHMITMFTMEALSTVVPAAVAAGAAGAVGYQAGQTLYQRGTAMWNAAEALGGAYGGQTLGTMVGLSSNLQRAQDMAQGGVFGIAGGLRDLVGQGSGAFTGMGVQTIAMIDRGVAAMVLHNRMAAVTQALSGGTGFLQSFGDIGANIGDTLLNLAPNLPGIGPDLLGGLKGITGAAAFLTGHIPGPLLGAGLAAEAGWRWGGPILGGGKLPGWLGGAKFGGLAGLAERLGLGTVADAGAGIEGAGLAGLLGTAGGPLGLTAALAALGFSSLNRIQSPAQRNIAGWQGAINQSFGAGALTPITKALYQTSQAAATVPAYVQMAAPTKQQLASKEGLALEEAYKQSPGQLYPQYAQSVAQQLGDLVAAGPSAIKALSGIGIKGATLTQAFEAMSMAMVSPRDFRGGQLDATARQQLQQFYQTYRTAAIGGQPGTASGLLAAGAADYIMSSSAMKSLSQINRGLDATTQIMTGGPAGVAALFGMLGGTPVTRTRAGLRLPAGPAYPAMASALSNIFTPQGAAGWSTFAGPQGLVAAQQANLDQMRTYLTLGAISGQQGAQLGAFELQSMLPLAQQSPMALSMLMSQGMQANIPGMGYYDPKRSLAQNYAAALKAITGSAGTAAGAQGILTQGTVGVANLPAIAASLITGGMGGPSALQSGLTAQMTQQALALQAHPLLKGGGVNMPALTALMSSMTAGGVKPGQMTIGVDAVLKNLHVPQGVISQINAAINQAMGGAKGKDVKVTTSADLHGAQLAKAAMAAVKDKNVHAITFADTAGAKAAAAAMAAVHDKTVYIHVIQDTVIISRAMTAATNPYPGGISGRAQKGMRVPGWGGGDIFPAMLEPGELVVPKDMVGSGMVDHLRGRIPGFQSGGWINNPTSAQWAAIDAHRAGHPGGTNVSAAVQQFAREFAVQILQGLTGAIKNLGPEASAAAKALVNKLGQEIQFAKGVTSATVQGLNLGGMDMTQGGSVAGGMQSYLGSIQAFTADLKTLSRQGLSKGILSQLIAAGPVQGDVLSQSILGFGTTGGSQVGQVNKLWAQINAASRALGAQSAMAMYGGTLAPNLKSATVTSNNVSINVSVSGGGGNLNLSDAQIKQLIEIIQARLLEQARRNPRTGVKLPGRGA